MVAPEMRAQLNSLKDLFDAQAALIVSQQDQINNILIALDGVSALIDTAILGTANTANTVDASPTVISNPPTQAQVTSIRDKLNELINALQR